MFKSFFNKFKKDPTKKPPRDPVCGMQASDGITFDYKGQTYAFCSDHCRSQFEKNPESYIKK
jgi:YHS domain-containing protein